ncbi:VOC family protein [Altererythrobacter sp. GH1-8]|uniref:VOC family protein n=1 Tax=Altererythrobacter sp. GH1-8 TaxID=3349333 RepID=UPI00374DBA2B
MPKGTIEHVNISVTNPARSAGLFQKLLGWHIRWEGGSMNGGHTIHVGTETSYLALYTGEHVKGDYSKGQPLNHVGFLVDDLDAAERLVEEHGLEPFGHDDYNPGKRFYFCDWDGIEFEIVSYEGSAS